MSEADRLFGWTPYRVSRDNADVVVDWCHLAHRRLLEPLFRQSVAAAMAEPFNLVFQQRTGAATLAALPQGLPPQGFVFHAAPAAATAIAQALAACGNAVVVSQAQPLRAALSARREDLFAGLVNAYAQQRFAYELCLFAVFDAADVSEIALVRRAYPDVPWLFLYKDRGGHDVEADQADLVGARAEAALSAHRSGDRGIILDAADLAAALESLLPAYFNFAPDHEVAVLMREALLRTLPVERSAARDDGSGAAMPEAILSALRRAATRP